jgi:hypothetical protein
MLDNVKIMDVTKDAYFAATELGEDLKLEPNDASRRHDAPKQHCRNILL